eukprot:4700170-Pyramimonas_sp.AAC.1
MLNVPILMYRAEGCAAPELIDKGDMPGGRAAERPRGHAKRRAKGRATGTHRGTCQGDALRNVPMD